MASSPENISYFAPDQNAVQSPRSSRPLGKGLGKPLRVRKTSEVSRSVSHHRYLIKPTNLIEAEEADSK
jgi:hypothetical protein